jgi:hypothetical protein
MKNEPNFNHPFHNGRLSLRFDGSIGPVQPLGLAQPAPVRAQLCSSGVSKTPRLKPQSSTKMPTQKRTQFHLMPINRRLAVFFIADWHPAPIGWLEVHESKCVNEKTKPIPSGYAITNGWE